MVVYADILIVVNTIVDYFILRTTEFFLHNKIKLWRLIFASLLGGFSSLYIYIPETSLLFEVFYRFFVCFLLSVICYGIKPLKKTLFSGLIILTVTCAYTGSMIALWYLFKPNGMMINNSVVYFDISPITVVIFTAIFYIVFTVLNYIFRRTSVASERCILEVAAENKMISLVAIIDTGNSIQDHLSNSEVIITDKRQIHTLFGTESLLDEKLIKRYRKIPCGTVTGKHLLDAYRCDYAIAKAKDKTVRLDKPILAISAIDFSDDYSAIVNPRIFI